MSMAIIIPVVFLFWVASIYAAVWKERPLNEDRKRALAQHASDPVEYFVMLFASCGLAGGAVLGAGVGIILGQPGEGAAVGLGLGLSWGLTVGLVRGLVARGGKAPGSEEKEEQG